MMTTVSYFYIDATPRVPFPFRFGWSKARGQNSNARPDQGAKLRQPEAIPSELTLMMPKYGANFLRSIDLPSIHETHGIGLSFTEFNTSIEGRLCNVRW